MITSQIKSLGVFYIDW